MLTIRCSTRLLKGLRAPDAPGPEGPAPRLGEWYATILQFRPRPVVLLVNEPTRLATVLPIRDFAEPGEKIVAAILQVLADLGVGAVVLEEERRAMAGVSFSRNANRGITAATNELAVRLEQLRELNPRLTERVASAKLGQMPIAIPGHGSRRPADVAIALLARD